MTEDLRVSLVIAAASVVGIAWGRALSGLGVARPEHPTLAAPGAFAMALAVAGWGITGRVEAGAGAVAAAVGVPIVWVLAQRLAAELGAVAAWLPIETAVAPMAPEHAQDAARWTRGVIAVTLRVLPWFAVLVPLLGMAAPGRLVALLDLVGVLWRVGAAMLCVLLALEAARRDTPWEVRVAPVAAWLLAAWVVLGLGFVGAILLCGGLAFAAARAWPDEIREVRAGFDLLGRMGFGLMAVELGDGPARVGPVGIQETWVLRDDDTAEAWRNSRLRDALFRQAKPGGA